MELYYGKLRAIDTLMPGMTQPMEVEKELGPGTYLYSCCSPVGHPEGLGLRSGSAPRGMTFYDLHRG